MAIRKLQRIHDLDRERATLTIRQGKGRKDRMSTSTSGHAEIIQAIADGIEEG